VVGETKNGEKTDQGRAETCAACPCRSRCCQSKKGEARTINTDDKEPLRQRMHAKMEQQEAKDVDKKRKSIVEPFRSDKEYGFSRFRCARERKSGRECSLVCAAHNIKKISKAIIKGFVRPESGKLVANPI
jgi:transposase